MNSAAFDFFSISSQSITGSSVVSYIPPHTQTHTHDYDQDLKNWGPFVPTQN